MGAITLFSGEIALIDDADLDLVSGHVWRLTTGKKYAVSRPYVMGRNVNIYMHRLLLGAGKGQQVDHANGNGLDNRRSNLRLCSQSQNNANITTGKRSSTGFRGVYMHPNGLFFAAISHNGRMKNLGTYASKIDAANAYDSAKRLIYKEFAVCNFAENS